MCRWMAQGLPICYTMIGRAIRVWVRILCKQSGLTWRRLFWNGSHILPTSPLASYLWWRPGSELLPPPITEGREPHSWDSSGDHRGILFFSAVSGEHTPADREIDHSRRDGQSQACHSCRDCTPTWMTT